MCNIGQTTDDDDNERTIFSLARTIILLFKLLHGASSTHQVHLLGLVHILSTYLHHPYVLCSAVIMQGSRHVNAQKDSSAAEVFDRSAARKTLHITWWACLSNICQRRSGTHHTFWQIGREKLLTLQKVLHPSDKSLSKSHDFSTSVASPLTRAGTASSAEYYCSHW
jgi:hypothetical protein